MDEKAVGLRAILMSKRILIRKISGILGLLSIFWGFYFMMAYVVKIGRDYMGVERENAVAFPSACAFIVLGTAVFLTSSRHLEERVESLENDIDKIKDKLKKNVL